MLKSLLASAVFAGLIAGLFAAGLQHVFLVPLISEAELYETGTITHYGGVEAVVQEHGHGSDVADDHSHTTATTTGEEGGGDLVRNLLTVMNTVLITCGFGMMLVAGFALAERMGLTRIDPRTGFLFGLAGFAATQLMPSLGLSPEMPGGAAGDLIHRQLWWISTAAVTIAGVGLIAFGNTVTKIAGAVLIAAPHLVGAPHPHDYAGVVPPELSALFAARVLVVGALGWMALGTLAGHFWSRETSVT